MPYEGEEKYMPFFDGLVIGLAADEAKKSSITVPICVIERAS